MNDLNINLKEFFGQHISTSWEDAQFGQLSHQGNGDAYLYKKNQYTTDFYTKLGKFVKTINNIEVTHFLQHNDNFHEDMF